MNDKFKSGVFFGSQIDIDCACHVLLGIDWDHSMGGNHRKCRLGFYLQILQQTNPFIFSETTSDMIKQYIKNRWGWNVKSTKSFFSRSVSIFFFIKKLFK